MRLIGGGQVKWLLFACLSYKYDQRRQKKLGPGAFLLDFLLPVYVSVCLIN